MLLSSLLEGTEGATDSFDAEVDQEDSGSQDPQHQWAKVRFLLDQKKMLDKDIALWKKRIEQQQKENVGFLVTCCVLHIWYAFRVHELCW
jgi:hypothetical protein